MSRGNRIDLLPVAASEVAFQLEILEIKKHCYVLEGSRNRVIIYIKIT